MGMVILHMSMSLDGFVAGPNVGMERPLGEGGERLHDWLFDSGDPRDAEVAAEMVAEIGAVVLGNRTFTVGEEHWGGATPYPVPSFVLTHSARKELVKGATSFIFVTDGVENALERAREAAGEKAVILMGAETAQQFLRAGLLDEIQLNLVPVLLGDGLRLLEHLGTDHIELERLRVIESSRATHLRFRVLKP